MGDRRRYRLSLPRRDSLVGAGTRRLAADCLVRCLAAAALVTFVATSASWAKPPELPKGPFPLSVQPVPLSPPDPERRVVGAFEYRGGLVLRSTERPFGGISGLLVTPDCSAFRAVSDHGIWISGRLVYDAGGDLSGVADARLKAIIGEKGRQIRGKRGRDAEAVARMPDGSALVSFEGSNAMRLYGPDGQPPRRLVSPLQRGDGPNNAGIEAVTALADGTLLAISEDIPAASGDGLMAWVGGNGQPWRTAVFHIDSGFRPTGAATLPNGDVIVLERRVLPPAARLRHLRQGDVQPDAVLRGDERARFDGPLTYDNMEAVAARTAANGGTPPLLASDDNYNWFQRTLFIMLAMPR